MRSRPTRINPVLCIALLLGVLLIPTTLRPARAADPAANAPATAEPSADSAKEKDKDKARKKKKPKPIKSFRVHIEARRDLPQRSLPAKVGRQSPMAYNIEKLPILFEQNVTSLTVVDQPWGFEVRVKFDSPGTRLLENYTSAGVGRHLIVATEIEGEVRWLAAPLIRQRISDGTLTFSPDASREEMERMVRDIAAQLRKERRNRWLP